MARRRLKSGRKRPVGRPAVAERRERDAARLKRERHILAEMGVVYVTICVDVDIADALKDQIKIKRLRGLLDHAIDAQDAEMVTALRAKLALAEIAVDRAARARAAAKIQRERLDRQTIERFSGRSPIGGSARL